MHDITDTDTTVPAERLGTALHDEDGAQALEYMGVAGLGAAIIAVLVSFIQGGGLEPLISGLIDALLQFVVGLFAAV